MQLNGTSLVDRYARPSVGNKVALRTFFLNNGQLLDPYDVSACTVFARVSNFTPSGVVGDDGLIDSDYSSVVLMNFGVSGDVGAPHDGADGRTTSQNLTWVSDTLYSPGNQASGIYRSDTGDYVAVLDGEVDLSGFFDQKGVAFEVANGASSVQEYIDVWTVKLFQSSEYQVFVNQFSLTDDTFTTITEPLILNASEKLVTKHVRIGEIIDMVIPTEFTVINRSIPESIKNTLTNYPISDVLVEVQKVNEDNVNQPAREVIQAFGAANVTVGSDSTILYNLDTNTLAPTTGVPGNYIITVRYNLLNQTFQSSPLYFTVS
jgi:hypothetical protein